MIDASIWELWNVFHRTIGSAQPQPSGVMDSLVVEVGIS